MSTAHHVWCRSNHTCFIDSNHNDAMHIVTGCLHFTLTDYLPILADIEPAELRQHGEHFAWEIIA